MNYVLLFSLFTAFTLPATLQSYSFGRHGYTEHTHPPPILPRKKKLCKMLPVNLSGVGVTMPVWVGC